MLSPSSPLSSVNHPEVLLNMLSPTDQDKFLQQFSLLNSEQQNYAFRQFLSVRREIQQFAISQFLKLDPETLIVSVQAEIDREKGLRTSNSEPTPPPPRLPPQRPPPQQRPPPPQVQQTQFNSFNKRDNELLSSNHPRRDEIEAFRIARQLQKQQQEQLEEIIKQQNRINLQLQNTNVFL